jgi:hypothetical protein
VPNLLLLPLDGQRTRLDLPFLSLKEEQMRHDLPQIELDVQQTELNPLPMPSDLFQIKPEKPQLLFCSEQIVAHPPQTRPCLRLISFHGG